MFENSLKNIEKAMSKPGNNLYWSWFNLMSCYASRNEKEKALEYVKKLTDAENQYFASYTIQNLKSNPIFDCIRNEQEFVTFSQMAETSFQREHDKIKKLLRDEKIIR